MTELPSLTTCQRMTIKNMPVAAGTTKTNHAFTQPETLVMSARATICRLTCSR